MAPKLYDLVIIGGGINGCGIARDASGRGLKVLLAEAGDLAGGTSSGSTKLFHGGLRYLEYLEVRLVREALIERETLLRAMPHISWPMRFVLPLHPGMRFDSATPVSRMLGIVMPWMRGRRPDWLIRLGLFAYDHLGGRRILPPTSRLDLTRAPEGAPLKPEFAQAFEYSDCWVQDSRLVVLNARDAEARGATILTGTRVTGARAEGGQWQVTLDDGRRVWARALVNAGGPWARKIIGEVMGLNTRETIRLVRGSHVVTRRLFDHDKAYFLQGPDGRIIFAIPYEQDYTLIGTTDAEHTDPDTPPVCTEAERDYLLAFASRYFRQPLTPEDVVWSYSAVRPLYDDGATSATAATRDYVLKVETSAGAPVLNIFGGKITTYRRLAESALEKLSAHVPMGGAWTAGVALPGGDFPVDGVATLIAELRARHPFLTAPWAQRLVRAYGTEAAMILAGASGPADLGPDFGGTLTGREVDWLMAREWARTPEDVLWRRSRLGLRLTPAQVAALGDYMGAARQAA